MKKINDYYTIYSNGKVFSHITNKFIVADTSNKFGYLRVTLYKPHRQRWLLHRLVAEYFLPKVEGKNFVNHKDGNKNNNCVSNLEWVTRSENEKHAFDYGLKPTIPCTINGKKYNSIQDAAKDLNESYNVTYYRLYNDKFRNYVLNA